jgi:homoserine dehydrogenase
VLLLGLGTVGGGVYRRLASIPEHFRVVGAFVRFGLRRNREGIPETLLHTDESLLQEIDADIVVDALPGLEALSRLPCAFLKRGIDLVSANKAVIAEFGPALGALAARYGASLRYSAAVGGSAPMIAAVRRLAANGEIASVTAILSGTCNFVLDQCERGVLLHVAVRDAQERGYAEADATEDLSGRDAARKLRILARHAFAREVDVMSVEGIDEGRLEQQLSGGSSGQRLRLMATAVKLHSGCINASVRLERLNEFHPLACVAGEWNACAIVLTNGDTTIVTGRGAGRWPTTEAVMADLFELRRESYESRVKDHNA